MTGRAFSGLYRRLAPPPADSDADLLDRYVRTGDGAAFELLVHRHGPMVLGVCRRSLGDGPDAEDAFQATFLVLVRKAGTVSPRGHVGSWLYGVARRTAAHARAARRRLPAAALPEMPDPRAREPDDLAAMLDAELAGLPERYRAMVVLCELEGRTLAEAAGLAGVPVGTAASRLARGRKELAGRLARRGLAVPAAGLALTVGDLPAVAADPSAGVVQLARTVLREMAVSKLRVVGAAAVVFAAAVGVAGIVAQQPPGEPQSNKYAGLLDPKKGEPDFSWLDAVWRNLAEDEPQASRALLTLAARPKEAVPFLKGKLPPLKIDLDVVKGSVVDLGSEDAKVWRPAYDRMSYLDPRLAMSPVELFELAKTPLTRRRLGALLADAGNPEMYMDARIDRVHAESGTIFLTLVGIPPPGPIGAPEIEYRITPRVADVRRRSWIRATRAAVLIAHLGGSDAVAILKEMSAGHPEALPTVVAKQGAVDLTRPAP